MNGENPFEEKSASLGSSAHTITQAIFVAIGLIYATGFLVIFTHLDRFGVREVGNEFFRAKYVHVGILAAAFPIIFIGTAFAIIEIKRLEKNQKPQVSQPVAQPAAERTKRPRPQKVYTGSILITANFFMVFYIFIMFAPKGFFLNKPYVPVLIFLLTFLGLLGIQYFCKGQQKIQKNARMLLCFLLFVADAFWLAGIMSWSELGDMLWPRGATFLLCVVSMTLLVWRLMMRSEA